MISYMNIFIILYFKQMKKTNNNTKKWQQQLSDVSDQLFNDIEKGDRQEQESPQEKIQQKIPETNPNKKKKEFAWMSDSDEDIVTANKKQATQASKNVMVKELNKNEEIEIFVNKISSKILEEDIKKYFEKFGEVTEIFIPLNEGTTLNKGRAFIKIIPKDIQMLFGKKHTLKKTEIQIYKSYADYQQKSLKYQQGQKRDRSRSRSQQR